jgi:hypothetical protein
MRDRKEMKMTLGFLAVSISVSGEDQSSDLTILFETSMRHPGRNTEKAITYRNQG